MMIPKYSLDEIFTLDLNILNQILPHLEPSDLVNLMLFGEKIKKQIDVFSSLINTCLDCPDDCFSHIKTISGEAAMDFIKLLRGRNEQLKKPISIDKHCSDKALLHYAVITDDVTTIPYEQLAIWFHQVTGFELATVGLKSLDKTTGKFEQIKKTLAECAQQPFAANLLCIALAREYSQARTQEQWQERSFIIKIFKDLLDKRKLLNLPEQKYLNLSCASLNSADLQDAYFDGANLQKAQFLRARLRGADFRETNLSDTNFWYAKLEGANFWGTDLHTANILISNISGCDLRKANLSKISLEYVLFDETTQFSFDDPKKLPLFMNTNNHSVAAGIKDSLDSLYPKIQNHPRIYEIRQCVVNQLKQLLNYEYRPDSSYDNLYFKHYQEKYDVAYHHPVIATYQKFNLANTINNFFDRTLFETNAQKELRTWYEEKNVTIDERRLEHTPCH